MMINLTGKKVLITGSARRIGKALALASAKAGAAVILHHNNSPDEASKTASLIEKMGVEVEVIRADFSSPATAITEFKEVLQKHKNIYALVNNAAVFKPVNFTRTSLEDWQMHMNVNLTMPFLLSQLFASIKKDSKGRIVNILDWRAFRPGHDHFPYTISKSALVALTQSTALALAPNIQVNGLALGAILPPSDGTQEDVIIKKVPAGRWATIEELQKAFLFLLQGPEYMTGEIIHLDGGRHLV